MLSFSFLARVEIKFLLLFILLFCNYSSFTQPAGIPATDNCCNTASSIYDSVLLRSIKQVDSIGHTDGPAGHFSRIYTASMSNINVQLAGMDSAAQLFIKKFEISFIGYFLEACTEFEKKQLLPGSVWDCYFSNPGVQSWQLTLVGVNAHINGDIWKGLVKNFSAKEIRLYKKNLLSFQSSIAKAFYPFFNDILTQSSFLRFMNGFTKGMAKHYGEWLIYNWRLRQINLALLYYRDQDKFKKKLAIINSKKHRIDQVILSKNAFRMLPFYPLQK